MKKKFIVLATVVIALVSCFSLTGCMLGGLITSLEAVYNFVQGFGEDELPEVAVYGSGNDLAVGFRDGKMVAFWDKAEGARYMLGVVKGDGTVYYDPNDEEHPEYADYYGDDCFYLENVGLNYSDSFSVSLRTLGKNNLYNTYTASYDGISKSDYEKYTANVPGGFKDIDRYIATRYEMFEFFAYIVIFRPDAVAVADNKSAYEKVEEKFYVAYDYRGLYGDELDADSAFKSEVMSAVASFEDSAAYNYSYDLNGNIGEYSLKFYYDVNPYRITSSCGKYRNTRKAEMPHYSLVGGEKERHFPIDDRANEVVVSSSDQLYFAIKKGYRPLPVAGSNADYVYAELRRILSVINSDSTTEYSKAHNIYDYIVDTVVYDYDFVDNVLEQKVDDQSIFFTYNCIYMEGVLGFRNSRFNTAERAAICDGLSKAFLCFTQIEGVDSVKVSGTASGGSHAWNKVKINNRWYMVDTTWGNVLDGKNKRNATNEYLTHDYFLVADDINHVEDKWFSYPKANVKYNAAFN